MKRIRIATFLFLSLYLFCFSSLTVCAGDAPAGMAELSVQERDYLQNKKTLKVAIMIEEKPFFYETEDGPRGLPTLILNRLAEETGILLEFVPAQSYHQALEQLYAGEVDLVGMLAEHSDEKAIQAEASSVKMVPYLTAQAMLLQHKNTKLSSLHVIALAQIRGQNMLGSDPKIHAIYYTNVTECMNAVRCGQADAAIFDSFTGAALLQRYEAKDLMSIPINQMLSLGFGLLPETDESLRSALEKTISSFTDEELTSILLEGSGYGAHNLLEFVYRYPFELICFGASMTFVIILALVIYTKVKIRQHQALQGYEESYRLLSDTFGEAGIEYDYLNDSLTIFGQHSNLDIDQTTNDFTDNLKNKSVRIALTVGQWTRMINDGVEGKAFSTEFQCGVKTGEWVWYRLIYTVICTSESHRRPIRLVGCLANVDAEHAEKEKLMQLSSNDQLTGLLNRKTAEEQIRSLLNQNADFRMGMMVVLDIDYFKKFNDQQGHLCGDEVLRNLGQTVRDTFLQKDILSRWGGDEFLFFLVESQNNLQDFTDRIGLLREKMNNHRYHGLSCPVTLSIGGASSYPGCTFEVLFQQADDALYLAKKHGRNRFWLYSPTEQKHLDRQKENCNET